VACDPTTDGGAGSNFAVEVRFAQNRNLCYTKDMPKARPLEERFWAKVDVIDDEDSCWLWKGSKNPGGYGHIKVASYVVESAHRVSYLLNIGLVPDEKPYVLHKCDNPSCVRPSHLYAGTAEDNMNDMARRGRHSVGVGRQPSISEEVAVEIRVLYASGKISMRAVGERYGISAASVHHIVHKSRAFDRRKRDK
jgi:hypothetical protein